MVYSFHFVQTEFTDHAHRINYVTSLMENPFSENIISKLFFRKKLVK